MELGEKIKIRRKELNLTQNELCERTGLSRKTISDYENCNKLPESKETYDILADALQIDVSLLKGDNEFFDKSYSLYGSIGAIQAQKLVSELGALFAGGSLNNEDLDGVIKAVQEHYWKAKELQNRK